MPDSNIIPFSFEDHAVRVTERDGDPWFVLADVCRVLDHGNPSMAASRLDDDEKMTLSIADGHDGRRGGAQFQTIINESGLWSLVLTSRKPAARRFKKWITAEVIPSIRKTGGYGVVDAATALSDPAVLRMLVLQKTEKQIELEARIEADAPRVEAFDRIATADGSLCITDAAKTLQRRPKDLFDFLRSHRWIYTPHGGRGDVAYSTALQQGLMEHKTTTVHRSDGSEKVITQARVTPKGLARLAQEFPAPAVGLRRAA